jgi:hypothetical protein
MKLIGSILVVSGFASPINWFGNSNYAPVNSNVQNIVYIENEIESDINVNMRGIKSMKYDGDEPNQGRIRKCTFLCLKNQFDIHGNFYTKCSKIFIDDFDLIFKLKSF